MSTCKRWFMNLFNVKFVCLFSYETGAAPPIPPMHVDTCKFNSERKWPASLSVLHTIMQNSSFLWYANQPFYPLRSIIQVLACISNYWMRFASFQQITPILPVGPKGHMACFMVSLIHLNKFKHLSMHLQKGRCPALPVINGCQLRSIRAEDQGR